MPSQAPRAADLLNQWEFGGGPARTQGHLQQEPMLTLPIKKIILALAYKAPKMRSHFNAKFISKIWTSKNATGFFGNLGFALQIKYICYSTSCAGGHCFAAFVFVAVAVHLLVPLKKSPECSCLRKIT